MTTTEEVLYCLSKAMVFSVLDAKDGFWQVNLEGKSSFLITFWNPFWWYRMLLMPFGTCITPEDFLQLLTRPCCFISLLIYITHLCVCPLHGLVQRKPHRIIILKPWPMFSTHFQLLLAFADFMKTLRKSLINK